MARTVHTVRNGMHSVWRLQPPHTATRTHADAQCGTLTSDATPPAAAYASAMMRVRISR
jgi:hypothetical protein